MTNGGVRRRTRKPFKRIFVPIAHAGCRRRTQGMKMRPGRWKWLGVVGATSANPLDSGFRRNDDWGAGMTSAGAVAFRHS